jgi:heme/copper-type cytochrome/quinol oxidase subunit 1
MGVPGTNLVTTGVLVESALVLLSFPPLQAEIAIMKQERIKNPLFFVRF